MIAGKQYYGPAADTWSLGVILFALVCGHLPFEDPNTSNLYRKILSGEYKTPKWISPEVKDLIRKILETDPEKRLTISQIRLHPWCQMVPIQSIPKEEPNPDEIEETKTEVFKRLEEIGLDAQSVLDAVASHACNSLSAMYYLLMQKEQLKLRLSKKFSTNSARPETSDRNLLSGIQGVTPRNLEKVSDSNDLQPTQPLISEAEGVAKSVQSSKVVIPGDPSKKIPSVVAPAKPQIPKLNIKPGQGVASNPLVSQSARVEGNLSNQPRGQLAGIQNPSAPHNSGAATARPVLEEPVVIEPPLNETSPKRGVIIRGTTIDNTAHDGNHTREAAGELAIVANGLVQLPPVEAERPTTRRSKSRGGKAPEGGLSPEYQADGPGMGKIPSSEALSTQVDVKQPMVPREPPKSGGANGGRRGKHVIPTSQAQAPSEDVAHQPSSNLVPTPPNKPKPSAVTTLTDPRSIYQGRQGIGAKPIQPIARELMTPRAPSAPNTKPPDLSARALAQKNKQSQQVGSITLGMESAQPAASGGPMDSAMNQSPASVLVA